MLGYIFFGLVLAILVLAFLVLTSIQVMDWLEKRKREKANAEWQNKRWQERRLALALSTAIRMKDRSGEKQALENYLMFLRKTDPDATEALARHNAILEEIAVATGH